MTYAVTPRPHIVRVPRHTILLRLFQLFVATTILVLTSYGVSVLAEDGVILTLVAGRPLPPSFHEDNFSTHSHMGNKTTQDVVDLPTDTTAVNETATNGTAASAASTTGGPRKLPSLLPQVWSRDASADAKKLKVVQVPTGPQYWESGREIMDPNSIPYNDMNLAKLCPSPASFGAPASAYPLDPNAPSVPGQEPDLHDGMRTWHVLSITGAKHVFRRLMDGAFQSGWKETERFKHRKERIDQGKSLRKIFKDDAREYLAAHGANTNQWGSPMKKSRVNIMAAPETMMWGHLQTAILSILHLILVLLATHCPPFARTYDYPLLWILEALLLLLWLISFCVLSAQIMAARTIGYGTACSEDGYCYTYASFDKRAYFLRLMSGCAALIGLMFLLYLVSFIIFTMSVRKHRREGGVKKPLSSDSKSSHPGPFSFDESQDLEDASNNTTDEEAGKPGKKSRRDKLLAKKQKKAKKEDAKAIKHMRKGGTSEWEKSVGRKEGKKHSATARGEILTNDKPRKKDSKRPKTHSKLSMSGFERKQMALSLGDLGPSVLAPGSPSLGEERTNRSEMEPAQLAPYPRGGEML